MKKRYWTKEEEEYLTQVYKLYSLEELAEIFKCTKKQVYTKLFGLGYIGGTYKEYDIPEGYKKCYRCEEILPYEEFYNNKSKPDGKSSECKHCDRAYNIMRRRQKQAEQEKLEEEARKQEYINSLKGKEIACKHHGIQTIDDYRIYKKRDGSFSRKCKKCESEYQQKNNAKKLKERGYI